MEMEITTINMIFTWGGSFLAGAFGIGVGYATLREQLKAYKAEFLAYQSTATAAAAAAASLAANELSHVKERVAKIDGKLEMQVGHPMCTEMRKGCQDGISKQLSALSSQVFENRTVVTEYITALQKFVGRVELYMEKNGMSAEHGGGRNYQDDRTGRG